MDSNRNIKGNVPNSGFLKTLNNNILKFTNLSYNINRGFPILSGFINLSGFPIFSINRGFPIISIANGFPILMSTPKFTRSLHTNIIKDKKKEAFKANVIGPLKNKKLYEMDELKLFSTMDIETISLKNFDNMQIPIVITSYSNPFINKIFIINNIKLEIAILNNDLNNIEKLVNNLWKEYIDYISNTPKNFETIFAHNLGSFDGLFLYKGLLKNLDITNISSIIDDKNDFISISYKFDKINITWKDSYRIFPVSLDGLYKSFNIVGKTDKYNPAFNDLSIFSNKDLYNNFIEYSLQDSKEEWRGGVG